MAELVVKDDVIWLKLSRLERLAALHVDIKVPLSAVVRATVADDARAVIRGLRWPGTGIPGTLLYGTMKGSFGRDFSAIRGRGPVLVLELSGQPFARLLVSTPDPAKTIDRLGLAVG
jgi:hypothetical protein